MIDNTVVLCRPSLTLQRWWPRIPSCQMNQLQQFPEKSDDAVDMWNLRMNAAREATLRPLRPAPRIRRRPGKDFSSEMMSQLEITGGKQISQHLSDLPPVHSG